MRGSPHNHNHNNTHIQYQQYHQYHHGCGGGAGGSGSGVGRRARPRHGWPEAAVAVYVAVAVAVTVCYWNGLRGDFVHDDIPAVAMNADVLGTGPLALVATNDFWGTPLSDPNSHKSYRPLTTLTFRCA
ncbi:PREDICTED: transmembrane and TPR repeat-containing protein 3-like [Diuraphis noxia]|uniref:transmembrane and TPR repeat-containing protein 3-like n=1 Tax=Diuraphis noxia TaxID=143948 RepID=UPI000763A85B|nr:PREDICTED: transmembrane and TPR repeat-containing protein 3-like [Diuraphis noxia]